MIHRVWSRSLFLVSVIAFVLLAPLKVVVCAQAGPEKIKSIELRGNKRIEGTAVRSRLTLKVGDPYTNEAIRTQIRLIYEMGFFEDVRIETEPLAGGIAVTFVVREKPFITEVVFDGNKNLSDDKLQEKITIRAQSFLDQQQAKESAERIRLAYQEDGYYNAQVIPIVLSLEEDRKRLTFFIKEGERTKIKTVKFDGMNAVTKKEVFKGMATREWVPWYGIFTATIPSVFSDAGTLKREELANDVERIKEVYLNKGYLNIQVGMPTIDLSPDKQWFTVTFPVVEGEPYTVNVVGFRGNTVFEEAELKAGMSIIPGEVFQRAKIRDELGRLTELYGSKGYAFTEVNPSVTPDPQARTAAIIFHIKEGELVRVRQIHISGNDKTRDNVIRRELRVNEQDIIDTAALKRSYQRLNNLNFFETVEILPKQVEPDKVDLDVKVKEKSTGMFSIGGGYSTLARIMIIADVTEGNLGGRGYLGRVRGQLGQLNSSAMLTFRNPYLEDSLTSLQLDGYRTQTMYGTFYEQKLGASATFGRWLSEYSSGSLALIVEDMRYSDPSTFFSNAFNLFGSTSNYGGLYGITTNIPQFIRNQFGTQVTTGFRFSFTRDTRDYYLNPRTGWRNSIHADFGTPYLGGTNNFYKVTLDTLKYTPLPFDTRFSVRAQFGIAHGIDGKPIPLTERFFVGGINSMRGFYFGRAGPVTSDGYMVGAAKELVFNFDYIFPISSAAKLNGVFFFDYGKGFNDDEKLSLNLRQDAGFEIRWISPFGPLRVAYGFNLHPKPFERKAVFNFSVGSVF